jgi:hypothetical protein
VASKDLSPGGYEIDAILRRQPEIEHAKDLAAQDQFLLRKNV